MWSVSTLLSNSYMSPLCFAFSFFPTSFPVPPCFTLDILYSSDSFTFCAALHFTAIFLSGISFLFFPTLDWLLSNKPLVSLESLHFKLGGTKCPFSRFCGFCLTGKYIKIFVQVKSDFLVYKHLIGEDYALLILA